jgi:adenosine deaminase
MELTLSQLRGLPKIELHRHLDCSMRWSTITEIARTLKIELGPRPSQRRDDFLITDQMQNLESVLNKFLITQKILASEEILTRLAFEVCEDAYNENIVMLELRYAPSFIEDGHANLNREKIHAALMKGLLLGEKKFGISTGLIGIIQRIKSPREAELAMNFFVERKQDYIGVDLADNEDDFDPLPFAPLFQKAKGAGLRVTVHSGETPHPQSGERILSAINDLGAERIGHGVQAIHHPEVMRILKEKKIPLEICPLSNWLTQAFPTFQDHPLRKLYDLGVPLTLNSDDPGLFVSTLTDDYEIAQRHHRFRLEDFKKINRIAFEASFLPQTVKSKWKNLFVENPVS